MAKKMYKGMDTKAFRYLTDTFEHNKFNFELLGNHPKRYWRGKDREDRVNLIKELINSKFDSTRVGSPKGSRVSNSSSKKSYEKKKVKSRLSKASLMKSLLANTYKDVGFSKVNSVFTHISEKETREGTLTHLNLSTKNRTTYKFRNLPSSGSKR